MKKCGVNRERAVVTHNQVAEVAEPGEGALDFPAPSVAPPLVRLGSPAHVQQDIYPTRQRPCAFRGIARDGIPEAAKTCGHLGTFERLEQHMKKPVA
jgi:hypothetical protein